jgi:O-antigen ligase
MPGPTMVTTTNPMGRIGTKLVLLLLFLLYSRISDLIGFRAYIVLSLSLVVIFLSILSGAVERALSSTVGKLLTAFTVWVLFTIPFSVWKGGSVQVLVGVWLKSFIFFVVVAGLIQGIDYCRKSMYIFAFAAVFVASVAHLQDYQIGERLSFETGRLANPNDLAYFLISSIPFSLLMTTEKSKGFRLGGWAATALFLVISIRTGSRMGMIMIGTLLLAYFFKVSLGKKMLMMVTVCLLGVVAVAVSPEGVVARYRTMFQDPEEVLASVDLTENPEVAREVEMAAGSTGARLALLKEGVRLALEHPILGVGPGMFGVALAGDPRLKGTRLRYRQPHNTYTQLSSETGVPGLLLYGAALIYCLGKSYKMYKVTRVHRELQRVTNMAYHLWLSLFVFTVSGFFASYAYDFTFPVLAGLLIAFERSFRIELTGYFQSHVAARQPSPAASPYPLAPSPGRGGKPLLSR